MNSSFAPRAWLDRALRIAGSTCWGVRRSGVTVLAWHDIHDEASFHAQIRWLCTDADLLSVAEFEQISRGALRAPRRAAFVTFDDGDRTVLDRGLPILAANRVEAILFVVPSVVGTMVPFWWVELDTLLERGARSPRIPPTYERAVSELKRMTDLDRRAVLAELREHRGPVVQQQLSPEELRQLATAGIQIGNHTFDHPCLDRVADAEVGAQLTRAHTQLAGWLSAPPRWFAWPNGNVDRRGVPMLESLGYVGAFAFDHRRYQVRSDRWTMSRVRVDTRNSADRFVAIVSGAHPATHRLRAGVSRVLRSRG